MAITLLLINFLHLAHWLAPGDWDFDDYLMILIAKMVIYGIIFGIHGDTDGVDAEASLEIKPLLSITYEKVVLVTMALMGMLGMKLTGDNTTSLPSESSEKETQPWFPFHWKQVRKPKNTQQHGLSHQNDNIFSMSKTDPDFCVPVLGLADGLHLISIMLVVPVQGLPLPLHLLPASGPALSLTIFSLWEAMRVDLVHLVVGEVKPIPKWKFD